MPNLWIYPPPELGADDPPGTPHGNPPWVVVIDNEDGTFDLSAFNTKALAREAVERAQLRAEVAAAKET